MEYFEVDDGGIGSFVILLHESLEGTISILQYSYLLLLFTVTHIEKEFLSVGDLEITKTTDILETVCVASFFFQTNSTGQKIY